MYKRIATLLVLVLVLVAVVATAARAVPQDNGSEACYEQVEVQDYERHEVQKTTWATDVRVSGNPGNAYWITSIASHNPLTINPLGTHDAPRIATEGKNQGESRFSGTDPYTANPTGTYYYKILQTQTEYELTEAPNGVGWHKVGSPKVGNGDEIPCPTTTTVPDTTTTTIPEVVPFCEAYTATIPQDGNGVVYLGIGYWNPYPSNLVPADADDLLVGYVHTVFSQVEDGFVRDPLPQGWTPVSEDTGHDPDLVAFFNFTTEEEVCNYDVPPISAQVIITTTTTTIPEETTTTTVPEETTTTTVVEDTTTTTAPEATTTTEVEDTTTTTAVEDTTTTVAGDTTTTVPDTTTTVPAELPLTGTDLLPFAIIGGLLAVLGTATLVATRKQ